MTQFINDEIRLTIKLDPAADHEEIRQTMRDYGSDEALHRLCENVLVNSDWEFIQPEQIGALTSSPILANGVVRNDYGTITEVGCAFWFPEYQMVDPVEQMLREGEVEFTAAP